MVVIYERSFDANEWFIVLALVAGIALIFFAPKLFTRLEAAALYLFGIAIVLLFDHTLSIRPWDFYDVNDTSKFQLIDFLYYLMNGPFSYFFIYFYKKWSVRGYAVLLYLLIWGGFSVLLEFIGAKFGLFHYKGYHLYWSFPIYATVQIALIVFYETAKKRLSFFAK